MNPTTRTTTTAAKTAAICLAALGAACSHGGQGFDPGADLATLPDYASFLGVSYSQSEDNRASHWPNAGGAFTLSADRTWTRLYLKTPVAAPAIFDLGGHTLTLNSCDALTEGSALMLNTDSTMILSNGTVNAVYDPETYPWTIANNYYSSRAGIQFSGVTGAWDRATLVIEKGATLRVTGSTGSNGNAGNAAARVRSNGNALVVKDGGTLDAPVSFVDGYHGNRVVFEKGATWTKLTDWVSSVNFPAGKNWGNGASNQFVICSADFLSGAGVTTLRLGNNVKSGSFHSGLVFSSPDFDWATGFTHVGEGSAPTLIEVRDGAKLVNAGVGDSYWAVVKNSAASGSQLIVDGEGSLISPGKSVRVGANNSMSNGLVRVSNGGCFATSGSIVLGIGVNSNSNTLEVLSGGHVSATAINIGYDNNVGCRFLVDGAGSTVTNNATQIGTPSSGSSTSGAGGHVLTVSNGATWCGTNNLAIGKAGTGNAMIVDGATATFWGNSTLGANGVLDGANRLEVRNGACVEIYQGGNSGNFISYGRNYIVIDGGSFKTRELYFPANGATYDAGSITLSGTAPRLESTPNKAHIGSNAVLNFVIPAEGFASAPIQSASTIEIGADVSIVIDPAAYLAESKSMTQIPLIFSSGGLGNVSDAALANADLGSARLSLAKSADNKTLLLKLKTATVIHMR